MLHVKRLLNHVSKVPPENRGLLTAQYNYLMKQYQNETSYHRSLWVSGRITLGEFRKVYNPKIKAMKKELETTAKILRGI
jgi:hypothetical protein